MKRVSRAMRVAIFCLAALATRASAQGAGSTGADNGGCGVVAVSSFAQKGIQSQFGGWTNAEPLGVASACQLSTQQNT